jgi:hypothetical protein
MVPSGDKHDASDNCGGENAWLPVDRKGGANSWRGRKFIVLTHGIKQRWEAMAILNTTGIHKQVGEPKKVRKKVSTFCVPKKVKSEGSPFSPPFFQSCNKQAISKWSLAGTKGTYNVLAKRGRKKKVTCNHQPNTPSQFHVAQTNGIGKH